MSYSGQAEGRARCTDSHLTPLCCSCSGASGIALLTTDSGMTVSTRAKMLASLLPSVVFSGGHQGTATHGSSNVTALRLQAGSRFSSTLACEKRSGTNERSRTSHLATELSEQLSGPTAIRYRSWPRLLNASYLSLRRLSELLYRKGLVRTLPDGDIGAVASLPGLRRASTVWAPAGHRRSVRACVRVRRGMSPGPARACSSAVRTVAAPCMFREGGGHVQLHGLETARNGPG